MDQTLDEGIKKVDSESRTQNHPIWSRLIIGRDSPAEIEVTAMLGDMGS